MGKLEWLGYNLVKIAWWSISCLGTIHQRDKHTDSHVAIAIAALTHCVGQQKLNTLVLCTRCIWQQWLAERRQAATETFYQLQNLQQKLFTQAHKLNLTSFALYSANYLYTANQPLYKSVLFCYILKWLHIGPGVINKCKIICIIQSHRRESRAKSWSPVNVMPPVLTSFLRSYLLNYLYSSNRWARVKKGFLQYLQLFLSINMGKLPCTAVPSRNRAWARCWLVSSKLLTTDHWDTDHSECPIVVGHRPA